MKVLTTPQSGSIAGQTASRNRNGQYLRARAIPVQPRSIAQRALRSSFAILSSQWRQLDGDQQGAWATWASQHPRTDSLGQSQIMTGAQAFIGINQVALNMGGSVILTPPKSPNLTNFVAGTLSSAVLAVTITGYVNPEGGQIQFLCCKPSAGGIGFFGKGKVVGQSEIGVSDPIDLGPGITAVWGTLQPGCELQILQVPVVNGQKFPSVSTNVSYSGVQTPPENDAWVSTGHAGNVTGTLADPSVSPAFFQIRAELVTGGRWVNSDPAAGTDTATVDTDAGSTSVQCRWGASSTPDSGWSDWSESQTVVVTGEGLAKPRKHKSSQ